MIPTRAFPAVSLLLLLLASPPARGAVAFTVDTTADEPDAAADGLCATAAGLCSLRAALTELNADAQGGTIAFSVPGGSTLSLASPLPAVARPAVLDGAGSPGLSVVRNLAAASATGGLLTLDPGAGVQVELRNLRLAGGKVTGNGGAVLALSGSLRVAGVTFEVNTASLGGGALSFTGGGALEVSGCAFSSNGAGWGGAIRLSGGTLALAGSLFYGNQATQEGGALSLGGGGAVSVSGSTLASNSAYQGAVATRGGAIAVDHGSATALLLRQVTIHGNSARAGGGLSLGNAAAATLENVALAGNFAMTAGQENDCEGAVTSATHSLLGISGGSCAVAHGSAGNLVGTAAAPIDARVQFDGLGFTTATLLLPQVGSPLRDAGDAAICALAGADPRGVSRSPGTDGDGDGTAGCDIGAAEAPAPGPPVILDFNATRTSLTEGESTSLHWSAQETTGCTIGDGSANPAVAVAAQGNLMVTPAATTTYTLTCPGVGVSPPPAAVATVAITVTPAPVVAITSFTATPASIAPGESSQLQWTEENATGCDLSDGTSSEYVPSYGGGSVTRTPAATTTYTLTCQGNGGPAVASVTVTVGAPGTVAITSFTATPASILAGGSATLAWAVADATACEITGDPAPASAPPPGGTLVVAPSATTTYTLTCQGNGGPAVASATVTVTLDQTPVIHSFTATLLGVAGDPAFPYARYSLQWETANWDLCQLWGELSGLSAPLAASGSEERTASGSAMMSALVVQLRCQRGALQQVERVDLVPPPSITVMPFGSIYVGESILIVAPVTRTSSCSLDGTPQNVAPCTGGWCVSLSLAPTATTTYALSCRGDDPLLVTTVSLTVTVKTQKSGGDGCSTAGSGGLPVVSLLGLLGLARRRRRADPAR